MRKLLFNLFLGIPGTILHIGGILAYMMLAGSQVLNPHEATLRGWLLISGTALIFAIGRAMVIGSDLLSGTLALPARKDLFAISAALEILAQGLCVTAGAFVIAGLPSLATKEFSGLAALWGIATLLFAATWIIHRAFKSCRAEASIDKAASDPEGPALPNDDPRPHPSDQD